MRGALLQYDQLPPARQHNREIHHEQHQVVVPAVAAPEAAIPHEDLLLYRAEHDQDQPNGGELCENPERHPGAAQQLRRTEKDREAGAGTDAAGACHRVLEMIQAAREEHHGDHEPQQQQPDVAELEQRRKHDVHQACACVRAAPSAWASTNHSHLSTPREISVQMSVESASPSSSVSSIARRMRSPKLASAFDSAQTCSSPLEMLMGYWGSSDRSATIAPVPSAMPPNWITRSASRSTYSSAASCSSSNSLWSAMNWGPFTFQCACFVCNWRSIASASRWFRRSIT